MDFDSQEETLYSQMASSFVSSNLLSFAIIFPFSLSSNRCPSLDPVLIDRSQYSAITSMWVSMWKKNRPVNCFISNQGSNSRHPPDGSFHHFAHWNSIQASGEEELPGIARLNICDEKSPPESVCIRTKDKREDEERRIPGPIGLLHTDPSLWSLYASTCKVLIQESESSLESSLCSIFLFLQLIRREAGKWVSAVAFASVMHLLFYPNTKFSQMYTYSSILLPRTLCLCELEEQNFASCILMFSLAWSVQFFFHISLWVFRLVCHTLVCLLSLFSHQLMFNDDGTNERENMAEEQKEDSFRTFFPSAYEL